MSDSVIPEPTADDLARDAAADLAVCEAAPAGPWDRIEPAVGGCRPDPAICGPQNGYPCVHSYAASKDDRNAVVAFTSLARTALPAWIRRWAKADNLAGDLAVDFVAEALARQKAEAEVARLRAALEQQNYAIEQALGNALYGTSPEPGVASWGEHTAEILAEVAARVVARLRERIKALEAGQGGPGSAHPAGE